MAINSFDLQSALFSLLSGDSTLDTLLGNNKIFDGIAPQGTAYPYIIISGESTSNIGTKSLDGNIYRVELDVWSQYRGAKQIKDITQRIYTILNNVTMNVSNASSVMSYVVSISSFAEVDGITRHGLVLVDFTIYDN